MSPGYDAPVHQLFTRVVPESCLACHAGNVETRKGSDLRLRLVENSIGCERCHGPGENHIERQTDAEVADADFDQSIVNPRRLPRKLLEAVCEQCHLQGDIQVPGRGVRPTDYRPGLALEEFRTEFRVRRPQRDMTIVGHFEQLRQSACYRRAETLTCVTCHDPHRPVLPAERTGYYRSVCLTCHADQGCKLLLPERQAKSENDCAACHMPPAETEVPHVAFTHHQIGVHPLKKDVATHDGDRALTALSDLAALSPADRQRSIALASAQLFGRMPPALAKSRTGLELGREVSELLRTLPVEATDALVEVARAEFDLTRGDAPQAAQAARRALELADSGTDVAVRALAVLALTAFRQNEFDEARDLFRQLTRLRRDASDWHHLGLCENNCGSVEAGVRALERAREIDPASIGSYEALAPIHQVRKELSAKQRLRDEIARLKRWRSTRDEPRGRAR